MSEWKVIRNWIVDENGTEVALIQSNLFKPSEIALQIVREHNALPGLVAALEKMLYAANGLVDVSEACEDAKRVLAQAEGRE